MCLNIGIVTCGPNEALIISGLFQGKEGSLVVGGRAIVLPGNEAYLRLYNGSKALS